MTRMPKTRVAAQSLSRMRGAKASRHASQEADPPDAAIEASARSLGIKIDKAWMPAIRTHLQVTLRHGALVASFALPDDAEPAPVFEP